MAKLLCVFLALSGAGSILAVTISSEFLAVDPGEMDTAMHAAAIPDADRATLQKPADVAARIVAMISDAARAPTGARLSAPAWGSP